MLRALQKKSSVNNNKNNNRSILNKLQGEKLLKKITKVQMSCGRTLSSLIYV